LKIVLSTRLEKISKAADPQRSDPERNSSRGQSDSPHISAAKDSFYSPEADDGSSTSLSSVSPISHNHALTRTKSLPSISDHAEPPSGNPSSTSATNDPFYPSYLKHPTQEQKLRSLNAAKPSGEPDLGPTAPTSSERVRSKEVFPYYQSASNAALWDGAGWDDMQHTTQTNSSLGVIMPELSPPRASLAGEWAAINLGGG
jgi:hypothetical protein